MSERNFGRDAMGRFPVVGCYGLLWHICRIFYIIWILIHINVILLFFFASPRPFVFGSHNFWGLHRVHVPRTGEALRPGHRGKFQLFHFWLRVWYFSMRSGRWQSSCRWSRRADRWIDVVGLVITMIHTFCMFPRKESYIYVVNGWMFMEYFGKV